MASINSIIGRLLRPTRIDPPQAEGAPADPRCSECGTIGSTRTPLLKIAAKKWSRRGRILIFALFALWWADHIGSWANSNWVHHSRSDIGSLDAVQRICPEPVSDDGALALLSHMEANGFRLDPGDALYRSTLDVFVMARPWRYDEDKDSLVIIWGWPLPSLYYFDFDVASDHAPAQWKVSRGYYFYQIYISDSGRRNYFTVQLTWFAISFCMLVALAWCISTVRRRLRLLLLTLGFVSILCLATTSMEMYGGLNYGTSSRGEPVTPAGITMADVLSNDRQARIDAGRRIASIIHSPTIPRYSRIYVHYDSRSVLNRWGTSVGVPFGLFSVDEVSYPTPDPVPASFELEGSSLTWSSAHSGAPTDSRLSISLSLPSLAYYIAIIVIAGWVIRIAIWQIGKRANPDWAQPRFACRTCGYDLSNTPPAQATSA